MAQVTLSSFGEEFVHRVLAALPAGVTRESLKVTPAGLVCYPQPRTRTLAILGCPTCLGALRGQDALGYPTVAGKTMVCYADLPDAPESIPNEVAANTWLCPDCRMPLPIPYPAWDAQHKE